MKRIVLIVGIAVALTGCSLLTDLGGCKTYASPSFSVSVKDSITKQPIAYGARLLWTGPVSGSSEFHWTDPTPPSPSMDSLQLTGPFEQAGTFDVTVRKDGYRDWKMRVTVKSDRCHVRSVSLTALLQRL